MKPAGGGEVDLERTFPRSNEALEAVFAFVVEFLAACGVATEAAFEIDLVLEELFTDFVKYNRSQHEIGIRMRRLGTMVQMTLWDRDVEPFDVTQVPEVDPERYIADRRVGGLGLHLVRKMVESIEYSYENRTSRILVVKRLEA